MKWATTILALLLGGVALSWSWIQVKTHTRMQAVMESRDDQRRESIKLLAQLYIATKPPKKQVIASLKAKSVDHYEKDGNIEVGDLSFSFQGEVVSGIEVFEYLDK